MANIALIIAGGIGARMGQDIPKQFINVHDKPVIVYTMEVFQKHPDIDSIEVVCLEGWHDVLRAYAKQFGIAKLENIVSGGKNGQDSIRNGLMDIHERYNSDNDVVLIHDAIRPLVSDEIISDSIRSCKRQGMGISAVTSMDNVMLTDDGICGLRSISRYAFRRIQTPQTYRLGDLQKYHKEAIEQGILNENDTNNMVSKLGQKVYLSKGSDLNIKINTVEDVEMFKSLYNMGNRDRQE